MIIYSLILTASISTKILAHVNVPMVHIPRSLRIMSVEYEPFSVITVSAIVDHPFLIEFIDELSIDDVAGGRIANWDIVKRKNRLFIRPLKNSKNVPLLVTTPTKSYVFDLISLKNTPENLLLTTSKLIVKQPEFLSKEIIVATENNEIASPILKYKNNKYSMQLMTQYSDIRPREVTDDGRFTYFKFPNNIQIPAIYRRTSLKTFDEWLVNWHRDGEYIVLHGVSEFWTLRLNGSVIGIFNEAYMPEGQKPIDGTTIPGMKRIDK